MARKLLGNVRQPLQNSAKEILPGTTALDAAMAFVFQNQIDNALAMIAEGDNITETEVEE